MLQFLKASFTHIRPFKLSLLLQKFSHRFCNLGKVFNEPPVISSKSQKLRISPTFLGASHSVTAVTLFGSTAIPSPDTTCPRNPTVLSQNSHLLNLAYSLCSLSFSIIILRCFSCSASSLEYISMSSINTTTNLSMFMKYAGAFVSPKDITIYSYKPYLVVKAVFGTSSSRIFNWK